MKELELRHLAPYLPYRLKASWNNKDGEAAQLVIMGIHDCGGRPSDNGPDFSLAVCWKEEDKCRANGYFYIHANYKPILRPMSDLMQPEHIIKIGYRSISRNGGESFTMKQYEYLFQNHFDVFGLIDAGLAIDINTLNVTLELP